MKIGIGTSFLKHMGRGLIAWALVVLVIGLWRFISAPIDTITTNFWLQLLIVPVVLFLMGLVVELTSRIWKRFLMNTFIPESLTKEKVIEWDSGDEIKKGLLLSKNGEYAEIMEIMGGPTSITWFPRKVKTSAIRPSNQGSIEFLLELVTLGISKTFRK